MDLLNSGNILGGISLIVALLVGLLTFITNHQANKRGDRQLSFDEQVEEEKRGDTISQRRKEELDRLYKRVDRLEAIATALQKSDRIKQTTIDNQAERIERTNETLADVRDLFSQFVQRVARDWPGDHPMPQLTSAEQAILERTIPHRTRATKEK